MFAHAMLLVAPATSHHTGFASEGQFLVISGASLRSLQSQVDALPARQGRPTVTSAHLRPNVVVDSPGLLPYNEDTWAELADEQRNFRLATLMPCSRCEMVCVNPQTGRCVAALTAM